MVSGQTLIDEALKLCATKRELAERLGMGETTFAAVRSGKRHLTPRQAVALAKMTENDPRDVLAQVTIERETDSRERARLRAAFFPLAALGALACASVVVLLAEQGTSAEALPSLLTVYTLCAIGEILLCSASPRLRRRAVWGLRPPRRHSDCPRFAPGLA